MESHAHFRYCTPSALAHSIIHGGWFSITFSMPMAVWPVWVLSHRSCSAVSSVCVGWPQLPLGAEMRPCPHRSAGGSALPAGVHTCTWTQEKYINTLCENIAIHNSKFVWSLIGMQYTLHVTIYMHWQSAYKPGNGISLQHKLNQYYSTKLWYTTLIYSLI